VTTIFASLTIGLLISIFKAQTNALYGVPSLAMFTSTTSSFLHRDRGLNSARIKPFGSPRFISQITSDALLRNLSSICTTIRKHFLSRIPEVDGSGFRVCGIQWHIRIWSSVKSVPALRSAASINGSSTLVASGTTVKKEFTERIIASHEPPIWGAPDGLNTHLISGYLFSS